MSQQAMRYVARNGEFSWVESAQPDDIDCTDLSDEEFEEVVSRVAGEIVDHHAEVRAKK